MTKKTNDISLIQLIGDAEENFYQLGLKDRDDHREIFNHISGLIKTPWKLVDKGVQDSIKLLLKSVLKQNSDFKRYLVAYSEGINRPPEDMAFAYLMPEVISAMSKWVPGLPYNLLGCSSFFTLDEEGQSPIHGRILDFPLQGSYEPTERAIHYQIQGMPQMIGLGAAGFFYPSITTMTEDGITFALHQKFTDIFNPKGTPIFQIVWDMLKNVKNHDDCIEFLKSQNSFTAWGLYIGFPDGRVLSYDILGDDHFYFSEQLSPGEVIYKCNRLVNPETEQKQFLPWGMENFNNLREKNAQDKIKLLKKGKINSKNLLKIMSSPISKKNGNPKKWNLETVTPSSLSISTLNPTKGELLTISGNAPKFYRETFKNFSDCWKKITVTDKKGKKPNENEKNYQLGIREMMSAQVCYDMKDHHQTYHHLQMAESYLEGYYEKNIAKFFFLVCQYIYESHTKVRSHLLLDFKELLPSLPEYLKEHTLLFIYRLEVILGKNSSVMEKSFSNEHLLKVFQFEKKLPPWVLHKATTILLNPRIDLLDIIYPHVSTR